MVVGAEDIATPPSDARVLARGIPSARLVVVERAAHLLNVEQPAAFNRALLEYLR